MIGDVIVVVAFMVMGTLVMKRARDKLGWRDKL